jgi:hypothetical protein
VGVAHPTFNNQMGGLYISLHVNYKYSITIHSNDLAIINCLRALSQYSQKEGNNRIPWGNTKDTDWKRDNNCATFRFTRPEYRDGFLDEINRLLPRGLCKEVRRSDSDPAKPTK